LTLAKSNFSMLRLKLLALKKHLPQKHSFKWRWTRNLGRNNLQIVPSSVANHHERTRRRNLSAVLIHYPIIIIDERKTRTKARRSTRDADKESKPRPLLWLCCSQLVSLIVLANREVMSAERMMAA
jgi:hypothetical protein